MAIVKKRPECPTTRREVAVGLTKGAIGYWAKKKYACQTELGVIKWGARRADVMCTNHRGEIVLLEVKSCIADLRTDKKLHEYLPFCNRMYVVLRMRDWLRVKAKGYELPPGVGVLALCPYPSGRMKVVRKAKFRMIPDETKLAMFIRIAWKSAPYSRGKGTRQLRVYLE